MDYIKLAEEFLKNSYQFKSCGHQKKIDETLQGEVFAMIYILKKDGMVLPSEISSEMNISSARVAAILRGLENKGFITREINKEDRRQILVCLTESGIKFTRKHNNMAINSTAKMLEALGEDDARELVRITRRLVELGPEIVKGSR